MCEIITHPGNFEKMKKKSLGYGFWLAIGPALIITFSLWLLKFSTGFKQSAINYWIGIPLSIYIATLFIAWLTTFFVGIVKGKTS